MMISIIFFIREIQISTRALRLHIKEISPDTELKVDLTYSDGYIEYGVPFPLGVDFFWPDVGI